MECYRGNKVSHELKLGDEYMKIHSFVLSQLLYKFKIFYYGKIRVKI